MISASKNERLLRKGFALLMGRDFLVNHSCVILDGAAVKLGIMLS